MFTGLAHSAEIISLGRGVERAQSACDEQTSIGDLRHSMTAIAERYLCGNQKLGLHSEHGTDSRGVTESRPLHKR
jgi:hypothetical protein